MKDILKWIILRILLKKIQTTGKCKHISATMLYPVSILAHHYTLSLCFSNHIYI